ncbi:hypothetical protein PSH66_25695 [Pseudomonas sp. FP597]|uniref:hypothetical protein n=1 Tax=Pseudomonas sp. FP597 TaxID=2954096 RepID=UPI002736EC0F|nr:hypothetical protein [Pseudomonas sp. FP597]WLI05939.1 hypothetical protein PSH66_25695 [Pseudomonas sp. FP597]
MAVQLQGSINGTLTVPGDGGIGAVFAFMGMDGHDCHRCERMKCSKLSLAMAAKEILGIDCLLLVDKKLGFGAEIG